MKLAEVLSESQRKEMERIVAAVRSEQEKGNTSLSRDDFLKATEVSEEDYGRGMVLPMSN